MGYERRHSSTVLNLTPLIDIVFLLLVFFMLTAHFIQEERIDIELPTANSSATDDDDQFVDVVLLPDGKLIVDGLEITEDKLTDTLRGALHAPGKRYVRLRGDRAAQFGNAVTIIDAARSAGAESLDIVTERP
ncbi:MAG: biopolymer transporter ExbD [Candidatus Sedimenticola sp. 20ELBAFRAG]